MRFHTPGWSCCTLAAFIDLSVLRVSCALLKMITAAEARVHVPQYKGLGELHDKYNGQGFEVLAFPCESTMCTSGAFTDASLRCTSQHASSNAPSHHDRLSISAGS